MNSAEQQIHQYGDHPDQHVHLVHTSASPAKGTAILVHGGYWRQRITASVMDPMLRQLVSVGWNVANVEYRRGPTHPWPQPEQDVAAAIAYVRAQDLMGPTILIGHSVGGQLVLLNANATDAAVALAPVTDVARVYDEGLGDFAAQEYFGVAPQEDAQLYAAASPAARTCLSVPVLLVHGTDDLRVPVTHSEHYLATRLDTNNVDTHFAQGLDHFQVIDPSESHWLEVLAWIDALASRVTDAPKIR